MGCGASQPTTPARQGKPVEGKPVLNGVDPSSSDGAMSKKGKYGRRGVSSFIDDSELPERETISLDDVEWLQRTLRDPANAHVFGDLTEEDLEQLPHRMQVHTVAEGELLYQEGDEDADQAYICGSGSFEVLMRQQAASSTGMGKVVRKIARGTVFGDVALLFDSPRTATVRALERSTVWSLSRQVYVRTFRDAALARTKRRVDWLRSFMFFYSADMPHLEALALSLKPTSLKKGEPLSQLLLQDAAALKEGMVYFVERGRLADDAKSMELRTRRVIAFCPPHQRDDLSQAATEWDRLRDEYMSVGLELKGKETLTDEKVAEIIESKEREKEEDEMQRKSEARGSRLVKRRSSASVAAVEALRQLNAGAFGYIMPDDMMHGAESLDHAEPEAKPENARSSSDGSYKGLDLVIRSIDMPPLWAQGEVKLLAVTLPHFMELLKPMHRLLIDWEDLRSDFASMPYSGGVAAFDHIHPLLNEQRSFAAGEPILTQGETNSTVFLVLEGEAMVTVQKEDGTLVTCASRRRGDFFGERTTLGLAETNTASIKAKTRCVCAIFDAGTAGTSTRREVPEILREHLEQVARHHNIPALIHLTDIEHVADLGAGGFGTVFLAKHLTNDERPLAVKCLLKSEIVKTTHRAHLMAEKTLMIELRHPFIVNMVGTFKDSERLFIAMEYVSGGELYGYIQERDGVLKPEEAPFVYASVTTMIDHIHKRNFIYRDLKPENLLITADGYLKLIDFGFAKELHKSERTFTCVGTLEYMAPEVLALSGHGYEADWWSAGVLFYEAQHECSPFIKDDPEAEDKEIIMKIRDPGFKMVIDAPGVTPPMAELISGLLTHDSDARWDAKHVHDCAFFKDFDWLALIRQTMPTPLAIPMSTGPFDTQSFEPDIDPGRTGPELLEMHVEPYDMSSNAWDAEF